MRETGKKPDRVPFEIRPKDDVRPAEQDWKWARDRFLIILNGMDDIRSIPGVVIPDEAWPAYVDVLARYYGGERADVLYEIMAHGSKKG